MHPIAICLACPFRGPADGACPCTIDGRDIKEHAEAGYCPKGFYDQPMTLAGVAHGAAALVKLAIGRDKASPELVAEREAICSGCEHGTMRLGLFHQCDICLCATAAKIRLAGEKCPKEKW